MQELVTLLGSPHLEQAVIHVTGTNGKTSVARIASELLVEQGLSTGVYTSPHLERVNERIMWNTREVDDETLAGLLSVIADVEPYLSERPSYFEILTGAAFRFFADVAAEVTVAEVGMGGRWDATNVVDARVAVVTNVSIDHVEYLGPTREQIAGEKAGIIDAGCTLVLGETDRGLRPIFERSDASTVWLRDRDFGVTENLLAHGGRRVSLFTRGAHYPEVFLSLHGAHQADNAAVALAAVECFLARALDADVVSEVLGRVSSPGRLEVLGHQPLVVLDGAHNVAGAHALVGALAEEWLPAPRTYVVGFLREKDPVEMLEALGAPDAERIVCCRPPSPRARPAEDVAAAARSLGVDPARIETVDDVGEAVGSALARTEADGQVVVTGSLYVVGAARAVLRERAPDPVPDPPPDRGRE